MGWLLWLLAGLIAFGQGQYSFRNWQAEDGLPVNYVHSIVQAADGHLWIATAECIVRFDGLDFERVEQIPSFPYPHNGEKRLFATPDGTVWFSSNRGGLLRIDQGVASPVFNDGKENALPVTQVVAAAKGDDGVIVKRGEEIWQVRGRVPELLSLPDAAIIKLLADDAMHRLNHGRLGPDDNPGRLVDRSGSAWVVSPAGDLTVTSAEGQKRATPMPRVSQDSHVTEMLEDRDGNIWVGTALNGLGLFREDRVEVVNAAAGLSEGAVFAVIEDSRGNTWLGNRKGGVDRIVERSIEHYELPGTAGDCHVSAMHEDRDGRLWVATVEGPVFRWKDSQFIEQYPGVAGLSKVEAIYHDGTGTMWFGGQLGLVRAVGRQTMELNDEAGFPGGEVTAMAGGTSSELWLGTSQGYVLRDTHGELETIATPQDLSQSRVSSILVSAEDQVWVTTLGAGLFLYDGTKWQRFDRGKGLPDPRLTQVVDDKQGYLWFGSTGGIIRASRADLIASSNDPKEPIHWLRMDRSDGLPTRECLGGHHPAGWRFNDGTIWFPTSLGVVRLDPERTMVNRSAPAVFMRRLSADGIDHPATTEKLRIGPGRNRLVFSYHGLNFCAPEKVSYRTRLVGLDDTWRDVGNQRLTTYESVPPGDYRFEVLAMNGDGLISPQAALMKVVVRPHFWQSGWFFAQAAMATVLLAGGIGWLIARDRLKRGLALLQIRNTREVERARIARDLHDDLGASLTEISLLADLGAEQAAGTVFQKHLDELSQKSRTLGLTLDEIVWAVSPREDTLASLLDYLGSFATEFLDRANIRLRLDIASGMPDRPLDATVRHSIFLAVREAFNNVVKHSAAKSAWLSVFISNDALDIRVEDDGIGLDEEALSRGNGLANFAQRMQICGGQSSITQRDGGGTRVRFLVPMLAPAPENQ